MGNSEFILQWLLCRWEHVDDTTQYMKMSISAVFGTRGIAWEGTRGSYPRWKILRCAKLACTEPGGGGVVRMCGEPSAARSQIIAGSPWQDGKERSTPAAALH